MPFCCQDLTNPQNFRASKELFRKLVASQGRYTRGSSSCPVSSRLPTPAWKLPLDKDMLYPHGMREGRQVLSLVDGYGREGVTPFPHRWCGWGHPEHLPESAGFSLYGPRRKTLFQRTMYPSQKGKTKLFKGSRMNFWLSHHKCNGHKMAAEARILEWTGARLYPKAKVIYSKEYRLLLKL